MFSLSVGDGVGRAYLRLRKVHYEHVSVKMKSRSPVFGPGLASLFFGAFWFGGVVVCWLLFVCLMLVFCCLEFGAHCFH